MKKRFLATLLCLCMVVALLPTVALATEDVIDVYNITQFNTALASDATIINVKGSVTCSEPITKPVTINIEEGQALTMHFGTEDVISKTNFIIDGTLYFYNDVSGSQKILALMGKCTVRETGRITQLSPNYGGTISFKGDFVNKGKVDATYNYTYFKYGTEIGNVTGAYLRTDLCLYTPTKHDYVYINEIIGTPAIGEKLYAVVDGFGKVEADDVFKLRWGNNKSGSFVETGTPAQHEYIVQAGDAGGNIAVWLNGVFAKSSEQGFIIVDEANHIVKQVRDSGTTESNPVFTTDKVPQPQTVYLDAANGKDSNSGSSPGQALQSWANAYNAVQAGGTISICGSVVIPKGDSFSKDVIISGCDDRSSLTLDNFKLVSANVTFSNIKLAATGSLPGVFGITKNDVRLTLDAVTLDTEDVNWWVQQDIPSNKYTDVVIHFANMTAAFGISGGQTAEGAFDVTLDRASIYSAFDSSTVLGNVTMKNGSSLMTKQIIRNLTSEGSDNKLILLADGNTASPITIDGDVVISENDPIALLRSDKAPFADEQTLITSTSENTSLTADKFTLVSQPSMELVKENHAIQAKTKALSVTLTAGDAGIAGFQYSTDGTTYTDYTAPVTVNHGDSLWVKAILATGCAFEKWDTGITANPYQITDIAAPVSYTPTSTRNTYAVTVTSGSGGGNYAEGATVTITADAPEAGKRFKEWTISPSSVVFTEGNATTATAKFEMPAQAVTAIATYETIPHTITVSASPTEGGTVTGGGAFDENASCTVTATAKSNYRFVRWTEGGAEVSTSPSYTFFLTTNRDLVAVFEYTGGGSGGGHSPPSYPVTVPETPRGAVTVDPKNATVGTTVTVSPTPDEGKQVDRVIVTDKNGYEIPVTENSNGTYSYKQPSGGATVKVTFKDKAWVAPFSDAKDTDWFYEDVQYVYEQGLMQGTDSTTFSPHLTTTRGMIVTILYRMENEPGMTDACPFDDVKPGSYYENAITWAAANGIADGYGGGKFRSDDSITREQFATILWRYAKYRGYDVSAGEDTNILSYNDAFDISQYAIPALQWACGAGIMQGDNGNLMPQGNATRAQAAAMLHRFCESVAE